MKRKDFPNHKKEKQEKADELKEARARRTDEQQLAHLDKLFGAGLGAARERARLLDRIGKKP